MSDSSLILDSAPASSAGDAPATAIGEEGRSLPSNVEAEAAFLGAVLIDN